MTRKTYTRKLTALVTAIGKHHGSTAIGNSLREMRRNIETRKGQINYKAAWDSLKPFRELYGVH